MKPLDELVDELDALLRDLHEAGWAHRAAIEAVAPVHRAGATNLVHYVALRGHDLQELQSDLMDIGVTSLATPEADVLAKVTAARNVVAALRGDPERANLGAIHDAFQTGDHVLAANARDLFGACRPGRSSRVMVTLPTEAADDPDLVAAMIDAGLDIARINCAHDDADTWQRMINQVHAASGRAGRPILVSMDIAGPKMRTGSIAEGPAVGRARVTHDDAGHTMAPAALWLTPADSPRPAPALRDPRTRPALAATADAAWLANRRRGDMITFRDNRGRKRRYRVVDAGPDGVLAHGYRSAYVADGTVLRSGHTTTEVHGIPPVPQTLRLDVDDRLILTTDGTPADPPRSGAPARIGCTPSLVVAALRPGERVVLDDGAIEGVVEATEDAGHAVDGYATATVHITRTKPGGKKLAADKGVNVPDTRLEMSALTDDDRGALPFVAAHADMVAASFVRTADDVAEILDAVAPHLGLVLKIETKEGFANLPTILLAAMRHPRLGVMIARGDLAVELGFERLVEVPRQMLGLCEAARIPVVWATDVLETLAKTGVPSRAEITDAGTAQRAECVMLNKGPRITDAIAVLDDLIARLGTVQRKSRTLLRRVHSWDDQPATPIKTAQ